MGNVRQGVIGWLCILGCYFAGNAVVTFTGVALPPALVGMILLFLLLLFRDKQVKPVAKAGVPLLRHMSLLFVPAVLGITLYWRDIQALALPLFISIVVTTVVSLAITLIVAHYLIGRYKGLPDER